MTVSPSGAPARTAGRTTARTAARTVVLVTALAAGVLVGLAPAEAVTSHRPLNDTRAVGSAPVSVSFPIEYFGVVADLPSGRRLSDRGRAPYGEVRFRTDGHWSAWQPMDQDAAQAPGHLTGALVPVDRADGYQVRGLPALGHHWRAAAINTTDGATVVVGHRRAGTAYAAESGFPACESRADWGADESITGWSRGTDTQLFYPDQVLTVHHTATSNDPAQDYAATVRAIYSYHVQTNGWSDIGYQYLVDGHGTVYEGRNSGHTSRSCLTDGGDGSDFAHRGTDDYMVTGAHVAGWNSGNLGISLLGCYEPQSSCAGDATPPAAAEDALEHLVADLSTRHGLDPTGSTGYVNPVNGSTKTVPTVSGHRDWEPTACPGGNLYADLPTIRTTAKSLMAPGSTPSYVERTAVGEANVAGTVSGTYTDTWAENDSRVESVTEVSSGGKPSKRYATLTHRWDFDVAAGSSVTFSVDAAATGESFDFAWSADDATYHPMVTVAPASADSAKTFVLPASTSGRVYVRVTDADHTAGRSTPGTLTVDRLAFRSDTAATGTGQTLSAPGTPTLSPTTAGIGVAWAAGTGQIGYEVQRADGGCPADPSAFTTQARVSADVTSWTDTTAVAGQTYGYRVVGYDGTGATAASGCTAATASGITLTATSRKSHGQNTVTLRWTGATAAVDVRRDGAVLATTTGGTTSYTDSSLPKGGGSYGYAVCPAGGTDGCSNPVTVAF